MKQKQDQNLSQNQNQSSKSSLLIILDLLYIMLLDITCLDDYDKKIVPFIREGIIIDTSIIDILIDGLIEKKISKKEAPDYDNLMGFLNLIKIGNNWAKFLITPHILTETCRHLRDGYRLRHNYKEIVGEVLPILKNMGEELADKRKIINSVDFKNPIIKIGDISIFVVTESFINSSKKIAILAKDRHFKEKYEYDEKVMIMDYHIVKNIMLSRS